MKTKLSRYSSVLFLLLFCLLLSAYLGFNTSFFFTWKNLVNILEAISYRTILAVGMTFIIASGAIDLSVGSILSLSSIVMALCLKGGLPTAAAILIGIAAGGVLGGINGTLVHITRINALIITLATSFLYRGLSLILTRGTPITKFPDAFRTFGYGDIFGMESGVTMALILLVLAFPLMYRMRCCHYIQSRGSNPEALKRCGVKTAPYRIGCFAAMGMLAALAGVIITARLNSAEPNAGLDMEMDAITAVIMGGTPLSGGTASLFGTAVAVFLLGLIRNGLTLLSVPSFYQQFTTGALLLFAVITAELKERRNRIV